MNINSIKKEINDLPFFIHQAALDIHSDLNTLNQICDACNHFGFSGFCTNLIRIPAARKRIGKNKKTKLIAVIAFPFGDIPYSLKKAEAEWAAEHGADELDLVPNFLHLHEGEIEKFAEEISYITATGLPTRVVLNSMTMPKDKLPIAIEACIDAEAIGIQTSNGFGPPISHSHISELSSLTKSRCSIKAAGGIKTIDLALQLINAGANSLGTSMGIELTKAFRTYSKDNE